MPDALAVYSATTAVYRQTLDPIAEVLHKDVERSQAHFAAQSGTAYVSQSYDTKNLPLCTKSGCIASPIRPSSPFAMVRVERLRNGAAGFKLKASFEPGAETFAKYTSPPCVDRNTRFDPSGCGTRFRNWVLEVFTTFSKQIPCGGV